MATTPPSALNDTTDNTAEFVGAVSLLAALEADDTDPRHHAVLPYLGMARAELTDFGQRRPARLVAVNVSDLETGMRDLDAQLSHLQATSPILQHTLRVDAARRLLDRARAAIA